MDTLAKRHSDSIFECRNASKMIEKTLICVSKGINLLSGIVMVLFSLAVAGP